MTFYRAGIPFAGNLPALSFFPLVLPFMRSLFAILVASLLISLVTASCSDNCSTLLATAESLMTERPDSALSILESVDGSRLSGEQQARHALLLSRAYDKNYINITSDSLISIATGYYNRHGDERHRMMALFYQATAYYNGGAYEKAVTDATSSYELACKVNDSYWRAKSAELLADLFYLTYNNDECIRFRKISVSSYAETGDVDYVNWARLSLAVNYSANKEYDLSISIIDSIMPDVCNSSRDSLFKYHCVQSLFLLCVFSDRLEQAKTCFNDLRDFNSCQLTAIDYGYIGYVEVKLGNIDEAKAYIDSAYMLVDKDNLQELLAADLAYWEYLKRTGDKTDIVSFTEKLIDIQGEIAERTVEQRAVGAQRDYYNIKAVSAVREVSQAYRYIIFGIVGFSLLILVLITFVRMKMQLKNKEIELKISEIALLSARLRECDANPLDNATSENGNLRHVVDRLIAEWFSPINSLFDEYYETGDSAVAKATMFARVEKEIKKITSKKRIDNIVKIVDDSLDGALTKLRVQLPLISDIDITFIALSIARLSPRAICLFLDIKIKTVYSKRKRLRDKISESDIDDKDMFLQYLA